MGHGNVLKANINLKKANINLKSIFIYGNSQIVIKMA